MSRYIDADKLIERLMHSPLFLVAPKNSKDGIIDLIVRQPTVDVVEVVRCKDCKHLTVVNNESIYARCEKTGYIFWSFETDTREHFCAYGERRENGK